MGRQAAWPGGVISGGGKRRADFSRARTRYPGLEWPPGYTPPFG
jgi:hypothetical protein